MSSLRTLPTVDIISATISILFTRVLKLAVMDIVPAHYLYAHVTIDFVQAYFHWFNYLRPAPGPENELKAANDAQPAQEASNRVPAGAV